MLATITEAKARLGELLREAAEEDVVGVRHGHPRGCARWSRALRRSARGAEDLKDRLPVYEERGVGAQPPGRLRQDGG